MFKYVILQEYLTICFMFYVQILTSQHSWTFFSDCLKKKTLSDADFFLFFFICWYLTWTVLLGLFHLYIFLRPCCAVNIAKWLLKKSVLCWNTEQTVWVLDVITQNQCLSLFSDDINKWKSSRRLTDQLKKSHLRFQKGCISTGGWYEFWLCCCLCFR